MPPEVNSGCRQRVCRAVETIPVAVVPNLLNALKALKARGWWAAALDSGDDVSDIQQADLPDRSR
ncbi:MAG: hypothetical protein R2843_03960 [Thermomicrobiales bacterium]